MRLEKQSILAEIKCWLTGASYCLLVDFRGLKVRQADDLRRRLGGLAAQMHVVPNRLCRRVLAELQWLPPAGVLSGPTALIFGQGDAAETAKLLKRFADEHRLPVVKAGRLEGRFYSPAEIQELVQLPSRPVLYALLASALAAPMCCLAGVARQKLASLVYVLQAVKEKQEAANRQAS